jgi:hypothetical protein
MVSPPAVLEVFDDAHYASTLFRKVKRSLELGPKYYLLNIPRYLWHRRAMKLPFWDFGALTNPLREFRKRPYGDFPLPPRYPEALEQLAAAGVRLTMPRARLEPLLGAWWASHRAPGYAIECGSYKGATALLLALLGRMNDVNQVVLMLDTFRGIPHTSGFDLARRRGDFVPPEDQVAIIERQAEVLAVRDRIEIHEGLFAETFGRFEQRDLRFAFIHIDANIYQGTWEACQFTIPRTAAGGIVVFDDYNGVCEFGARLAIDRYCTGRGLKPRPLAGSSAWLQVPLEPLQHAS